MNSNKAIFIISGLLLLQTISPFQAAVAISSSTAVLAETTNLLTNSGFESAPIDGNGWVLKKGLVSQDTTNVYEGTYSCNLTYVQDGDREVRIESDNITTDNTKKYFFAFHYWVDSPGGVGADIEWYYQGNCVETSSYSAYSSGGFWSYVDNIVAPPADPVDAVSVTFGGWNCGETDPMSVYVDAVEFCEVTNQSLHVNMQQIAATNRTINITLKITDNNHQAIDGATIEIANNTHDWSGTTNYGGQYNLSLSYTPLQFTLLVNASKNNYLTVNETFVIYIDPPAVDYTVDEFDGALLATIGLISIPFLALTQAWFLLNKKNRNRT